MMIMASSLIVAFISLFFGFLLDFFSKNAIAIVVDDKPRMVNVATVVDN